MRGKESVGGYVDDAAITAAVKSRMVEDKVVDTDAIKVETLNGNVVLSGSARTPIERMTAESIAMKVRGVKSVQNQVAAAALSRTARRDCYAAIVERRTDRRPTGLDADAARHRSPHRVAPTRADARRPSAPTGPGAASRISHSQ